jgi:hypothetical protein
LGEIHEACTEFDSAMGMRRLLEEAVAFLET